jgi:hypothetical protein
VVELSLKQLEKGEGNLEYNVRETATSWEEYSIFLEIGNINFREN